MWTARAFKYGGNPHPHIKLTRMKTFYLTFYVSFDLSKPWTFHNFTYQMKSFTVEYSI